jgi:hypothetical protein
MAHLWWHCNGVGPIQYRAEVDFPFYEHGVSTYNWSPPHDMPRERALKIDAKLERLRQKQLRIIARATGGHVYGDDSRHEGYGPYPHDQEPPHE